MTYARSPGSSSTPGEIIYETMKRVSRPSPSRRAIMAISLAIGPALPLYRWTPGFK
jgi:hypothetical protein